MSYSPACGPVLVVGVRQVRPLVGNFEHPLEDISVREPVVHTPRTRRLSKGRFVGVPEAQLSLFVDCQERDLVVQETSTAVNSGPFAIDEVGEFGDEPIVGVGSLPPTLPSGDVDPQCGARTNVLQNHSDKSSVGVRVSELNNRAEGVLPRLASFADLAEHNGGREHRSEEKQKRGQRSDERAPGRERGDSAGAGPDVEGNNYGHRDAAQESDQAKYDESSFGHHEASVRLSNDQTFLGEGESARVACTSGVPVIHQETVAGSGNGLLRSVGDGGQTAHLDVLDVTAVLSSSVAPTRTE